MGLSNKDLQDCLENLSMIELKNVLKAFSNNVLKVCPWHGSKDCSDNDLKVFPCHGSKDCSDNDLKVIGRKIAQTLT